MSPITQRTLEGRTEWVQKTQSRIELSRRFWANVENSGECWLWTGGTNGRYGKFRMPGRDAYAHRVSYEWYKGRIGIGMTIDHICENPLCVRPSHLQLVTQARNNSLRGLRKQTCPRGHDLTDPENCYIVRGIYRRCRICDRAFARARYGATRCTATSANGERCKRNTANSNGLCWAHQ